MTGNEQNFQLNGTDIYGFALFKENRWFNHWSCIETITRSIAGNGIQNGQIQLVHFQSQTIFLCQEFVAQNMVNVAMRIEQFNWFQAFFFDEINQFIPFIFI